MILRRFREYLVALLKERLNVDEFGVVREQILAFHFQRCQAMHVLQGIVANRSIEQSQRMIPVAARLNEEFVSATVLDAHRRAVLFRLSTMLPGRVSTWARKPTWYAYLIVEIMAAVGGRLVQVDSER